MIWALAVIVWGAVMAVMILALVWLGMNGLLATAIGLTVGGMIVVGLLIWIISVGGGPG